MGVLNVTPDSFSDGGRWQDPDAAIAHGVAMAQAGAGIVDVGGESTRPGAVTVPPGDERKRVLPIVRELVARGITVSIDTMHASTALAAVDAGAEIINDVSGGLADEGMARVVAETGVHFVAMHWRGGADVQAGYRDVVADVRSELKNRVAQLVVAGVPPERIVLDPGLGFAKDAGHNWQLLARLDELASLGHGILIGASRKRFIGALLPEGAPMEDRDPPTAVISALAARSGVWAVRVHDVAGDPSRPGCLGALAGWSDDMTTADRPNLDRIALTGLRATAFHGVLEHERRDGQLFLIDVTVHLSLREAASSDDLDDTVHYGVLAEKVVEAVESDPVDLIETVAERVATVALELLAGRVRRCDGAQAERADHGAVRRRLGVDLPEPPLMSVLKRQIEQPAVIAFGANLGDRAATLHAAATELAEADGVELVAMSGLHESIALKPGGADPTAPEYLNAVALVRTTLTPAALLALLHSIEELHGRERNEKWGDRTLDLDLVDFAGLTRPASDADGAAPDPAPPAGRRARFRAAAVARGRSGCGAPGSRTGRRPGRRPRCRRPPGVRLMTRSTPGPLVVIGVIGLVLGVLLQVGLAAMSMPKLRPEFSLAITLVLVGAAAVALAVPVRRATRGNPAHRVDPFYATRVVVLAKAAALGGALIAGVGLGLVLELAVRSGAPGADAYLRVFSVLGGGHRPARRRTRRGVPLHRPPVRRRGPGRGPTRTSSRVALMP